MQIALLCKNDLTNMLAQLEALTESQYTYPSEHLSKSTVGQHVRHVLEFYICLLNQGHKDYVDYDERERDLKIETEKEYAVAMGNNIIQSLGKIENNKSLLLKGNFTTSNFQATSCETNLERELIYCFEHSIHHQALIKVSLLEQKIEVLSNFGLAPSTIRYRSSTSTQN
jgi:uncharacterized damage-inducible protein DinB